jgi:hypothetical protein
MLKLLSFVTFVFAATRFLLPHDVSTHVTNSFAAAAHLFVGGLTGVFVYDRSRYWCLILAICLTVAEIVAFFFK